MTPETSGGERELQAVRSLLERSAVYRTISARAALCAAVLSFLAALYLRAPNRRAREFAVAWLVALALTAAATAFLLARAGKRDSRRLVSPEMRMVLRTIAPCLVIPAAITIWFLSTGYLGSQELLLVGVWIAFYGLALLATSWFAPASVAVLGWFFLLSALALPPISNADQDLISPRQLPNVLMAVTFGGFHLVYALCTWRRRAA